MKGTAPLSAHQPGGGPVAPANWLLATLPQADSRRLFPHLRPVSLIRGQVLYQAGEPPEHVYFLGKGLVSLVLTARDGAEVDVSIVGREGLVGDAALLGCEKTICQAVVRIAGSGLRMPASVLQEEFGRGGALQELLLRYLQALLIQTFQNTLCNRRHTVQERLSRWLLTARDRVQSDELELTQEFIARMLGTRRPGIAEAAGVLRQAGLIDSARGHFTIRDPGGLEVRACECYAVVREEYTRIFGSP